MKANKDNFRLLCRAYYELTGDSSVLNGDYWYQITDNCKSTFIQKFYHLYNEVHQMIKRGEVCRFPIFLNGQKMPYVINNINL